MEAIKVTNLEYAYPPEENELPVTLFDGLDLQIGQGSFVAILGHNGCGKSTLAKHLNAILLPTGGSTTMTPRSGL